MTDLRDIIAKNICELRTEMKMTQLQLADVLNYSDKAVSKWERGEALPDVTVLKQIADYFGVSVDYLLEAEHKDVMHSSRQLAAMRRRNKVVITILSIAAVWLVATIAFAVLVSVDVEFSAWLTYIYAIPLGSVCWLVFNCIWGKRKMNFIISSVILWGLILSVYLTLYMCMSRSLWVLFIVGIPLQFIITLLPGVGLFRYKAERKKK